MYDPLYAPRGFTKPGMYDYDNGAQEATVPLELPPKTGIRNVPHSLIDILPKDAALERYSWAIRPMFKLVNKCEEAREFISGLKKSLDQKLQSFNIVIPTASEQDDVKSSLEDIKGSISYLHSRLWAIDLSIRNLHPSNKTGATIAE